MGRVLPPPRCSFHHYSADKFLSEYKKCSLLVASCRTSHDQCLATLTMLMTYHGGVAVGWASIMDRPRQDHFCQPRNFRPFVSPWLARWQQDQSWICSAGLPSFAQQQHRCYPSHASRHHHTITLEVHQSLWVLNTALLALEQVLAYYKPLVVNQVLIFVNWSFNKLFKNILLLLSII